MLSVKKTLDQHRAITSFSSGNERMGFTVDIGRNTLFLLLLTVGFVFLLFVFLKLYRGRRAYHDFVGLFVIPACCEGVASSTFENEVRD